MPKEFIHDADYQREAILFHDNEQGDKVPFTEVISRTQLKVTWGRETGHVQLAIVTDDDPDGFHAQHITLDRVGCNHLIRLARRARDMAYGKDE